MIPNSTDEFNANGHVGVWTGDDVLGGHDYLSTGDGYSGAKEVHLFEVQDD